MAQLAENSVPIAEGLFEWLNDGAHLIGSKCLECSEVAFPQSSFCPRCCRQTTERVHLSQQGRLYSFTVQRFRPPPPFKGSEPFQPYGVGVIELPEGLRVTSVLEEGDPDRLRVGMLMELLVIPFFADNEGREVVGYKFKPVTEGKEPGPLS